VQKGFNSLGTKIIIPCFSDGICGKTLTVMEPEDFAVSLLGAYSTESFLNLQ
jgi:hypothetical protein